MKAMFVLTVKRDGGTQDVLGFYPAHYLENALVDAEKFLEDSYGSRRAIIRLEYYNPEGKDPVKGV